MRKLEEYSDKIEAKEEGKHIRMGACHVGEQEFIQLRSSSMSAPEAEAPALHSKYSAQACTLCIRIYVEEIV